MMTSTKRNTGETGKMALLIGVIVAVAVLAFSWIRMNASGSGSISKEVKQFKPGARDQHTRPPGADS